MARGRSNKRAYQILKTLTNPIKRKTMIIEDENQNNKRIADNESLLKTWTEYCNNLYNYPIKPNINKLTNRNQNNTDIEETLPILKSEVENAIYMLKNDKTPGNYNISAELIKHGGESIIKIYTEICQNIWKTKIWPDQWTKSLIIPIPKKGDTKKCSNYRTLSLIPHPSNILLRIILNRLIPQAE